MKHCNRQHLVVYHAHRHCMALAIIITLWHGVVRTTTKVNAKPEIRPKPGAQLLYNLIICDYLKLLRKYF